MKTVLLAKDGKSGNGGCPSVHMREDGMAVVQAPEVDADTFAGLPNVLPASGPSTSSPTSSCAPPTRSGSADGLAMGRRIDRCHQRGVRRAVHQLRAHRLPAGDPPGLRRELRGRALPRVHGRPPAASRSGEKPVGRHDQARGGGRESLPARPRRTEPLTDYLRYELGWSYPPNVEAGEDIRILPSQPGAGRPCRDHDYWLFDSSDLWVMEYADDGAFRCIEQVDEPGDDRQAAYWRDAALHQAIPYRDYMRRAELLAAS